MATSCHKIICKYDDLPDIGKGFRLETNNCKTLELVSSDNTVLIDGIIVDFAFDSTFIIVAQNSRNETNVTKVKTMDDNEHKVESEIGEINKYWIINKNRKSEYSLDSITNQVHYSNVYGPFKQEEYLLKRLELGVPSKLQLKNK